MISVIIPLMPVEPYTTIHKVAVKALECQTVECEIIVSKHSVKPYINKGRLLNKGIKQASHDVIWLCDADFIPEPTLLERMAKRLSEADVVFPMFYSPKYKQLRIADGAPFVKKKVLKDFGKFNESHKGISWVTFPFIRWCMDNVNMDCTDEFIIDINPATQRLAGKRHWKTSGELRSLYKEAVKDLQGLGVWP